MWIASDATPQIRLPKHIGYVEDVAERLIDRVSLPAPTWKLRARYETAKPFPYLILDNLFAAAHLCEMLQEISSLSKDKWVHHKEENLVKSNLRSAVDLGTAGYNYAALANSAGFLYLLSEITNIWGLLPDPYLGGGGYHLIPAGGRFSTHADTNAAPNIGLFRRLAMLTYLNQDWHPAYGGQLELWNAEATKCEAVVEPIFNRTIIMEIGDTNFHGVRPVLTKLRSRTCFATYYHTVGEKGFNPHSSIYANTLCRSKSSLAKKCVKELLPPIAVRALRMIR